MIKDRGQKKLAARYCAVRGTVPFVEVVVRSSTPLDSKPLDITDVDVMGVNLGQFGRTRRILFDCKTANKQSAVNRALWLSGLRHLVEAEAGFVIQAKAAPDTHRLAALTMGINLHSEDSFRRYAASLTSEYLKDSTYLDDMDRWDGLVGISSSTRALADLVFFATTQSALETSGPKGLRLGLSLLLHSGGELDPGKKLHKMLYGCLLSSFLLHVAMAVSALKDTFDFSMPRADFEQRLRYFLWEGRENYELRLKLRRALAERSGNGADSAPDFDLPEWGKLVELVRSYLEAPEALAGLPLLVKELAFRGDCPTLRPDADRRIVELFATNNRARQFIFSASAYVVQASGLPRTFQRDLETMINELIG